MSYESLAGSFGNQRNIADFKRILLRREDLLVLQYETDCGWVPEWFHPGKRDNYL